VNRQGSNSPLLLWLALLVLPILAFALYLQLNKAPVMDIRDLSPNNSVGGVSLITPLSIETHKSIVLKSPVVTPDEIKIPVGLDPEAARTAVQQVENGVYERATAMFEQELVDVEWAGAYEQSLREMFAQHHGLQRVSINSIRCHTSMCRIEVFTPRDTDADFFTAMFYDGLGNFRAGELKAEAAITRRMEQGMTSVYVARKDHTLGFY
jgi:hypothetical protein